MIRRLPVIATIVVFLAVGVMIRLGFWQLDRLAQKQALLARYEAAARDSEVVDWPADTAAAQELLYRRAHLSCPALTANSAIAGRNAAGQSGVTQVVTCRLGNGSAVLVALGWSLDPAATAWQGGEVTGIIAPGPRLVADPPLAGLEANARPDPSEIPNNHLAYAVQWFLFAAVALIIYALAVRKRLAGDGAGG